VPPLLLLSQLADLSRGNRPSEPDKVFGLLGGWLGFTLLGMVLVLAATTVTQSVVTVVVSRAVLGWTTSIGQALRLAAPRMLPLLGLSLLVGLIVALCAVAPFTLIVVIAIAAQSPGLVVLAVLVLLAGVAAGVYFWISYAVATPALILEPAPVLTAMRRSKWLVAGGWWRVLGILLLIGVMAFVIGSLAQIPVNFAQFTNFPSLMSTTRAGARPDPTAVLGAVFSPTVIVLSVVLTALAYGITQPFGIGVTTLLYHDLRIRKESFHLPLWQMSQLPDEPAVSPEPTGRPEPTT